MCQFVPVALTAVLFTAASERASRLLLGLSSRWCLLPDGGTHVSGQPPRSATDRQSDPISETSGSGGSRAPRSDWPQTSGGERDGAEGGGGV